MYNRSMLAFLSEGNLKAHVEYAKDLRLKHSIIEKSLPEIKGKSSGELIRLPVKRSLKNEILPNLISYEAHRTYFSSFTDRPAPSDIIRKEYGSESALCYKLFEAARSANYGFLYLYRDPRGRICFRTVLEPSEIMARENPLLLIDLFEHAYFSDYGYSYEKYLRAALAHLDFSRLAT